MYNRGALYIRSRPMLTEIYCNNKLSGNSSRMFMLKKTLKNQDVPKTTNTKTDKQKLMLFYATCSVDMAGKKRAPVMFCIWVKNGTCIYKRYGTCTIENEFENLTMR